MKLGKFLFVVLLFATNIYAATENVISVSGSAELSIPIDEVLMSLKYQKHGKQAKILEENGYQIGVKLKNLFQKYGISEDAIRHYNIELKSDQSYDSGYIRDKLKDDVTYIFSIEYRFLYDKFDLIDNFRKDCIQLGVTFFDISELRSKNRVKYEAKLKTMAYQNAKEKAELVINDSGFKLGKPVWIDVGRTSDYTSNYGLGAVYNPSFDIERESLFRQKKFSINETIKVRFSIE